MLGINKMKILNNKATVNSLFTVPSILALVACGGGGGGDQPQPNTAPVAVADVVQTAEDTPLVLALNDLMTNDSDVDNGDTLSIQSFTQPANGVVVDNGDDTLTYTPNADFNGSDSFEYTLSDGNGGTATATVTINITPVNDAPIISGIPDTTVDEDSAYSFTPAASDVDGDALTFSITNQPSWASFNTNTGALTGTPTNDDVGDDTGIVISVDDGAGPVALASFDIEVVNTNDAPIISGTPQGVSIAGGMYDFTPTLEDVDVGDTATFSVLGNDPWLSIDPNSGRLSGTPAAGDEGTTNITVTVTDSAGASDDLVFDVVVAEGFNEALYAEVSPSSTLTSEVMYHVADGTIATNGWASNEATPNIDLILDNATEIHRIDIQDLPNAGIQVNNATISFSIDGSPVVGASVVTGVLDDDGSVMSFAISPPVVADTVNVQLNDTTGVVSGLGEVGIFSALSPGQSEFIALRDLFNSDTTGNYTEVEECDFVSSQADRAQWVHLPEVDANSAGISNVLLQNARCRGIAVNESAIEGSFFLRNDNGITGAPDEFDIRLRVRSEAGDTASPDDGNDNDGIGTDANLRGMLGLMFSYEDSDNYYRYQISQRDGHRKLMKKSDGVFSQLAQSTLSYTLGEWINLRIVRQNGVIIVFQDGEQVLAAADSDVNGSQVALFCAKNRSCFFDNLIVLDAPSTPIVALSAPTAAFVDGDGSLVVSAVVNDTTTVGAVEFVVDDGTSVPMRQVINSAPFSHTFELGSVAANHSVRAYALDNSGDQINTMATMDESLQVGVNGVVLLTVGDSITEGLRDSDLSNDNSSVGVNAGRITSGGYQPLLTDALSTNNPGLPIKVLTEANANESTELGSQRIADLLARYPDTNAVLVKYGTNDHNTTASGLGSSPATAGTYKAFMQAIIDEINAAGVTAILATPLQFLGDNDFAEGLEYQGVIDELIVENAGLANPPVEGPDFYQFFTLTNPGQLDDQIHPNDTGYESMSDEWCNTLNGQTLGGNTISCTP